MRKIYPLGLKRKNGQSILAWITVCVLIEGCGVLESKSAGKSKNGDTTSPSTTSTTGNGGAPNPWDIRAGVTINGILGKLKLSCRNKVNSTRFNYDGSIAGIGSASITGTSIDVWDTIDDYNNNNLGLPPSVVSTWSDDTDCGGVESTPGDSNIWKDVTTNVSGKASSCADDRDRCTVQSKISGLLWSRVQSGPEGQTWAAAWNTCWNLSHNGLSNGWRLPTQKELMGAYIHGIRSIGDIMIGSQTNHNFWSGTSSSNIANNAWSVSLILGATNVIFKYNTHQVICVH